MSADFILVGDLVDIPLLFVESRCLLSEALALAVKHRRRFLSVFDADRLVGVVTFTPEVCLSAAHTSSQLTVSDVMEKEIPWLDASVDARTVPWGKSAFWAVRSEGRFFGLVDREHALMALIDNYAFAYWKELADELPVGVVAIDAHERVVLFNQMAKRILGVDSVATVGGKLREILPDSQLHEVLHTGQTRLGYKYKVGRKVIIANHVPLQIRGWHGAISVFQDISELERLQSELEGYRLMAKHLDAILDCSYDGIYITDANANTIWVNKAYERITGLEVKNLIGRNMRDIVAEGLLSGSLTLNVVRQRRVINMMQRTATGKEILVTGNPIFDEEGKVCLVVSNVRDMTELNRLRAELERSREQARSHQAELAQLRGQWASKVNIIARSKAMQEVIDLAKRVALVESTVLLLGESGVGKDRIAELIHYANPRAQSGTIVKINCAAFSKDLLESELFGYEGGAFTGAKRGGKPGLFEVANQGTLFLDEISEMPLELQAKLLRVIEDRTFLRVGGVKPVKADVRLVCASNKDLASMVEKGRFRLDLYYRINVVPIWIPPLRERPEDIIPLLAFYLEHFNKKYNSNKGFSPEAWDRLLQYHWPGNVRELVNLVERAVVTCQGDMITVADLPPQVREYLPRKNDSKLLRHAVEETTARLVLDAYKNYGSTRKAAKALGVSQTTVVRILKRLRESGEEGLGHESVE